MKIGDLVRILPSSFNDYRELYGNDDSPTEFLKEEGYYILIPTFIQVFTGELCIVLKVGKVGELDWVRIMKNDGTTGWIRDRWLEVLT